MFTLPAECTSDQAIAAIRDYDQAEAARLLELYPPAPEPEPYEPAPEDRAWLAPLDLAEITEDRAATLAWLALIEASHPEGTTSVARLAPAVTVTLI